jgi:hypothetical protein
MSSPANWSISSPSWAITPQQLRFSPPSTCSSIQVRRRPCRRDEAATARGSTQSLRINERRKPFFRWPRTHPSHQLLESFGEAYSAVITSGTTNPAAEVPARGRQIGVEDPSRAHAAGTGVDVVKASSGLRERGWLRIDLGQLGRRGAAISLNAASSARPTPRPKSSA